MKTSLKAIVGAMVWLAAFSFSAARAQVTVTPAEARAIAKEAYIYGFPLVDSYRIQYSYFVDRQNPEFKAPWNQIHNIPRVYTPADTAIQTPNSDTPYSFVGMDLRVEPSFLPCRLLTRIVISAFSSSTPTHIISTTSAAAPPATMVAVSLSPGRVGTARRPRV